MEHFFRVKGNTWCIDAGEAAVGLYRLGGQDAVLLDSGSGYQPEEAASLLRFLASEGLRIKAIIATHAHWDHTGNNRALAESCGCEIYMYGAEAYTHKSVEDLRFAWPYIPFQAMQPLYEKMECRTTVFLTPGEKEVEICGRRFGILHTPGHSRSHISIITEDGVAMLGDAVMTRELCRHFKLPYAENVSMDMETKRRLEGLPYGHYILSHKGVRDKEGLLLDIRQNLAHMEKRAEAVAECVRDGMGMDAIVAAVVDSMHIRIYGRMDYADIYGMVASYVCYLEETGRLEARLENGWLRYWRR